MVAAAVSDPGSLQLNGGLRAPVLCRFPGVERFRNGALSRRPLVSPFRVKDAKGLGICAPRGSIWQKGKAKGFRNRCADEWGVQSDVPALRRPPAPQQGPIWRDHQFSLRQPSPPVAKPGPSCDPQAAPRDEKLARNRSNQSARQPSPPAHIDCRMAGLSVRCWPLARSGRPARLCRNHSVRRMPVLMQVKAIPSEMTDCRRDDRPAPRQCPSR